MAQLTESYLRKIIKEELKSILKEGDEPLSFEDWLAKQKYTMEEYENLKPADKKILKDRYDNYKKNKAKPQETEDLNREGVRRVRSGT